MMAENDDIKRLARAVVPFEADTTRLEEQLDAVVEMFREKIKDAIETGLREATDRGVTTTEGSPAGFSETREATQPDPLLSEIKDTLASINGTVMEIRDSIPLK